MTGVSELRRLAEEYVEARTEFYAIPLNSAHTKHYQTASSRLNKAVSAYNAALTPEIVMALCDAIPPNTRIHRQG